MRRRPRRPRELALPLRESANAQEPEEAPGKPPSSASERRDSEVRARALPSGKAGRPSRSRPSRPGAGATETVRLGLRGRGAERGSGPSGGRPTPSCGRAAGSGAGDGPDHLPGTCGARVPAGGAGGGAAAAPRAARGGGAGAQAALPPPLDPRRAAPLGEARGSIAEAAGEERRAPPHLRLGRPAAAEFDRFSGESFPRSSGG